MFDEECALPCFYSCCLSDWGVFDPLSVQTITSYEFFEYKTNDIYYSTGEASPFGEHL